MIRNTSHLHLERIRREREWEKTGDRVTKIEIQIKKEERRKLNENKVRKKKIGNLLTKFRYLKEDS